MDIKELFGLQVRHIDGMLQEGKLFVANLDPDELWNIYLESFPEGTNEVFRERREHDCSTCRNFIKRFGNVVTIVNDEIVTVWDFSVPERSKYAPVFKAMRQAIKRSGILTLFVTSEKQFGLEVNLENVPDSNQVLEWRHFNYTLAREFVYRGNDTVAGVVGQNNNDVGVFARGMETITEDSLLSVLEIIADSDTGLHRGLEWKTQLEIYLQVMREYKAKPVPLKHNYLWKQFSVLPRSLTTLRNSSIGTLLVNLSEGMDINIAVNKYEATVSNGAYKRSKPVITKASIQKAKAKFEEMGFLSSLYRRYATLDDISINNTLYVDRKARSLLEKVDPFATLAKKVPFDPKELKSVAEVTIDKFVQDILPTANSLELLLENRLTPNLVSLIAPVDSEAPSMFKWDNTFSWAYNGNATGKLKDNVKLAGGNVEGVLRFSIQWNDVEDDQNDLDAHCKTPTNAHIFYARRTDNRSGGELDVDIRIPYKKVAVENITFPSLAKLPFGSYEFYVNNYQARGGKSGFRAEVEFLGQIFEYDYRSPLKTGENVIVAVVNYDRDGFTISHKIESMLSVKEVWGVSTQQFIPVKFVCHSPNYWEEGNRAGNKHYFFMLNDVINEGTPNGFFNEFLNEELRPHRKFIEALAYETAIAPCKNQLSGVGFSSTQKDEFFVRVTSQATKRVMKVRI